MRPRSGGRRSARDVEAQSLQGARDVADRVDGDAGIERGRLQLGVSEQDLDHANVDVLFEQMRGDPRVKPGECRKVCVDTRLEIPARFLAACTARLSCRADIGLTGFWPGNSQACGRAARHHWRNSSSGIVTS